MNSLLNISHYSAQFKESYQPQPVEAFLQRLGHQQMDSCTEIRIITLNSRLKGKYVGKTISGYYTDYQAAARDIEHMMGRLVYIAAFNHVTLNYCAEVAIA